MTNTALRSIAALLTLSLGLAACDTGQDPEAGEEATKTELTKVTIGLIPVAGAATLYIAQEQGFFADQGLDVEFEEILDPPAMIGALLNGEIDFGSLALIPAVVAASEGVPIKIVTGRETVALTPEDDYTVIMVRGDSPIKNASDLNGTTLAVNALNAYLHIVAAVAIDALGGDSSTIDFIEVPLPEGPAALDQGRVDAIVTLEPFRLAALDQGFREIMHPAGEVFPGHANGVMIASSERIEEDPELMTAFATALRDATEFANTEPEALAETLLSNTALTEEQVSRIIMPTFDMDIDRAGLDELVSVMLEYGFLEKAPDIDELLWQGN